jgi:hypothetical protein
MMGFEIAKHTLVRCENLDPNQYMLSLLKEGFRVGLIDRPEIFSIQEQVMLILKDLIILYTKGESTSIKTETAEELLNSIYYSIDAYVSSLGDPEAGIALLKSAGIKETYDKGVEVVALIFKEAKQLCQEIVRNKLDVPLEVYNTSVTEALPEFFENYSVVFGAHDTACSLDYPLVFDDMNVRGVFYISNYIGNLDIETQFCRLFSKADIAKTLTAYGRTCRIDYKESPVNLFEVLVNNSVFSALSGNEASELAITAPQYEIIMGKLTGLDYTQMDKVFNAAVEKLIIDLRIDRPKLVEYIYRYKKDFVYRVLNAVENNNLNNIVLVSRDGKPQNKDSAFIEAERLDDDSFRHVVQRIMDCRTAADKVNMIMSGVRSLEDFVDILNADCLFGDEYEAVFTALGDTELAVLAKVIFKEELRDGSMHLSEIPVSRKEESVEWQMEYMRFLQGLSGVRIKSIEECGRVLTIID